MIELSDECRKTIIEQAIPASTKAILEDKDERLSTFLDELAWYMVFNELPNN